MQAYIVFLHGGYGCIVDREHQGLVGRGQARLITATPIANHLPNGWKVNNLDNRIDIFGKYV